MAVKRGAAAVAAAAFAVGLSVGGPLAPVAAWADETGSASAGPSARDSSRTTGSAREQRASRAGISSSLRGGDGTTSTVAGAGAVEPKAAAARTAAAGSGPATVEESAADSAPATGALSARRARAAAAVADDLPATGTGPSAAAVTLDVPPAAEPQSAVPSALANNPAVTSSEIVPAAVDGAEAEVSAIAAPAARQRISPVNAIARFLESVSTWLSGLPTGPVTNFLQGALLLIRRALPPPNSGGGGGCGATASCPTNPGPIGADAIAAAISTGKAPELARYFADQMDLKVLDQENLYSRAQAELILKDFYAKHPVQSFRVAHASHPRNDSQFMSGTLNTSNGSYRVHVLMRNTGAGWAVTQVRIEPTD